jgi:excisionase family DNA binding protein
MKLKENQIMTPYMTTSEAAAYLRYSVRTIYHLINIGRLKSIQHQSRGRLRFLKSDLDAYAASLN